MNVHYYSDAITVNCCRGTVQMLWVLGRKPGKVLFSAADGSRPMTASTLAGRVFQARAAATGNARSPSVDRRVDGTMSVDVLADLKSVSRH